MDLGLQGKTVIQVFSHGWAPRWQGATAELPLPPGAASRAEILGGTAARFQGLT